MLRLIVISLFVANLLLLGFQLSKPTAQPETAARQTRVDDANIPTIHLLSELIQDQELMTGKRQCFSLGPFYSSEARDEIRARLLEVSVTISERQTQALVEKGYWVFMPPYESLLEANQALLSLQALGLKDIAVIYEGEWKNAISLGYFLRQENAQKRRKGLEDRGYAPLTRVKRQAEPRYWLDYEQDPGTGSIALDLQNLPDDFTQRALPCPQPNVFDFSVGSSQVPADVTAQVQPAEEEVESQPNQDADADPEENVGDAPDDSNAVAPSESEARGGFAEATADVMMLLQAQQENQDGGSQPAEDAGTDTDKNVEGSPDNGNETTPANSDDTTPGDSDEAVSGQSTEIEPDSGSEPETDGG